MPDIPGVCFGLDSTCSPLSAVTFSGIGIRSLTDAMMYSIALLMISIGDTRILGPDCSLIVLETCSKRFKFHISISDADMHQR
ncbi:hypothetical protein BLA34_22815 [Ralstonia solanacearum]|nr:hypothetical protein BLA34_22815 [Ralstonia solanacearum]